MSYTRLTLQDFKDKWNAEKVRHLEDGIVELYDTYANLSEEQKHKFRENIGVYSKEQLNLQTAALTAWGLSEGGRKVSSSLHFDGDMNDKLFIPAYKVPDFIAGDLLCGYSKISDDLLPLGLEGDPGLVVIGGAGNFCMFLLSTLLSLDSNSNPNDFIADLKASVTSENLMTAFTNIAMAPTKVMKNGIVAFDPEWINSIEDRYTTANDSNMLFMMEFLMYQLPVLTANNVGFGNAYTNGIPIIFHITEPTEDFPEIGTYVFSAHSLLDRLMPAEDIYMMPNIPMKNIPWAFIGDYFPSNLNLSPQVEWSTLNFTNHYNALTPVGNSLVWNGEYWLNGTDQFGRVCKLMSTKSNEWLQLTQYSNIRIFYDGKVQPLYPVNTNFIVFYCTEKDNLETSVIGCIKNHNSYGVSGVYIIEGIDNCTIYFDNIVDVAQIFNHKLPHDKYDCPAYEETVFVEHKAIWPEGEPVDGTFYSPGDGDIGYKKIATLEELGPGSIIEDFIIQGNFSDGTTSKNSADLEAMAPGGYYTYVSNGSNIAQFVYITDQGSIPIFVIVYSKDESATGFAALDPGVYSCLYFLFPQATEITYKKAKTVIHKIEEKYLPDMSVFNLSDMGLETVPMNGENWTVLTVDTTELQKACEKGPVKIIFESDLGRVSHNALFTSYGLNYQYVFSGYYQDQKFDVIIDIGPTAIQIKIKGV